MPEQNFKNHGRYVPAYHFIAPTLIMAVTVVTVINLFKSTKEGMWTAGMMVAISLILWILWWYERAFALRAQDRAIRSEENFRHFILTGKPLDKQLQMGQIIALRFAPDDEFVALCQRAVNEQLTSKDIKQAIKNWRADHHRA